MIHETLIADLQKNWNIFTRARKKKASKEKMKNNGNKRKPKLARLFYFK